MNQGIYKITNKETKKVYVGASHQIKQRIIKHFRSLKLGKHTNSQLQSDYNTYGRTSFSYGIIHPVSKFDAKEIMELENYYIKKHSENSYNKLLPNLIVVAPRNKEIPNDPKLRKSFFKRLIIQDGCWEWSGQKDEDGYCKVNYKDSMYTASRVAYYIATGKQPGDLQVCHKCDNPTCCRFDHLFLGTNQDNVNDRVRKGRGGLPWVTWDVVREIRHEYVHGKMTLRQMEQKYNYKGISAIVTNNSWYDPDYKYENVARKRRVNVFGAEPIKINKNAPKHISCKTYTTSYVNKILRISVATLCNWIKNGLVEDFIKVSKRNQFTIHHLINMRSVYKYNQVNDWTYGSNDKDRVNRYYTKRLKFLTKDKNMNQEAIYYYMRRLTSCS